MFMYPLSPIILRTILLLYPIAILTFFNTAILKKKQLRSISGGSQMRFIQKSFFPKMELDFYKFSYHAGSDFWGNI